MSALNEIEEAILQLHNRNAYIDSNPDIPPTPALVQPVNAQALMREFQVMKQKLADFEKASSHNSSAESESIPRSFSIASCSQESESLPRSFSVSSCSGMFKKYICLKIT